MDLTNINNFFIFFFLFLNLIFITYKKSYNFSEYSLNNKKIKSIPLFFTIIATNLSAFTFFGVTGASYRYGFAFFPIMGFGTAFMTISFIIIGIPLLKYSKNYSIYTASDFIEKRLNSKFLALLFSIFSLIFTLPYIATQIFTSGLLISDATGLNYKASTLLFITIISIYIFFGGMKSIIKTDIFQFSLMILFSIIVLVIFSKLIFIEKLFKNDLFPFDFRDGINNSIPLINLLSYYILWLLADPIFPHLNQRFIASYSDKSLIKTMIIYPIGLLFIFLSMNIAGVTGRLLYPNLNPNDADNILKILISNKFNFLKPLFYIASLASIMSTIDSQLLSCSLIISNDLLRKNKINENISLLITRISIIFIAFLSWFISLNPPKNILNFLTGSSFLGYASLFPILFSAIYLSFINNFFIVASFLSGIILVILESFRIVNFKIPNVLINLIIQIVVISIGLLFNSIKNSNYKSFHKRKVFEKIENIYLNKNTILIFIILFLLGFDFYNFFIQPLKIFGIPHWYYYHIFLLIFMSILLYNVFKKYIKN